MYPLGKSSSTPPLSLVLGVGADGADEDITNVGSLALNRGLTAAGDSEVENLNVGEDLTVEGDGEIVDLNVSGDLAVAGTTGVEDLNVGGDLSVVGAFGVEDLNVDGALTVAGDGAVENLTVASYLTTPRLNITKGSELTIAAGVITVTGSFHEVDTESDAAEDDLLTINGGSNGDFLILRPANDARRVRLRSSGNILVDDGTYLESSILGTFLVFDGTLNAWLVLAPSAGGQVLAYRLGHKFRLGSEESPTLGTATAGGGVLVGSLTLTEGFAYNVSVSIHGKQETTNHAFTYLGRATVFRSVGGNALLVEGSDIEVQKLLFNTSTGADQDASAIEVAFDTTATAVRITVTNNDVSNDLAMTVAGIAIGAHRYALEPNP